MGHTGDRQWRLGLHAAKYIKQNLGHVCSAFHVLGHYFNLLGPCGKEDCFVKLCEMLQLPGLWETARLKTGCPAKRQMTFLTFVCPSCSAKPVCAIYSAKMQPWTKRTFRPRDFSFLNLLFSRLSRIIVNIILSTKLHPDSSWAWDWGVQKIKISHIRLVF